MHKMDETHTVHSIRKRSQPHKSSHRFHLYTSPNGFHTMPETPISQKTALCFPLPDLLLCLASSPAYLFSPILLNIFPQFSSRQWMHKQFLWSLELALLCCLLSHTLCMIFSTSTWGISHRSFLVLLGEVVLEMLPRPVSMTSMWRRPAPRRTLMSA